MDNLKKKEIHQLLFNAIAKLIDEARKHVAHTVNDTLSLLYWQIGKRINKEVLQNKRAEYGKQIIVSLTRQLGEIYGKGFEEKNTRRMMQFADIFPDEQIVASLIRQLNWIPILALIPLKNPCVNFMPKCAA